MLSTVCQRTSGFGACDCMHSQWSWVAASVSVLASREDLGVESSLARVWSASVASEGSCRKSGGMMKSLRSPPLGWTKPNPFSLYL